MLRVGKNWVMLWFRVASAARTYLNRFAVKSGDRAVVFTNNDDAWTSALDLLGYHTESLDVTFDDNIVFGNVGVIHLRAENLADTTWTNNLFTGQVLLKGKPVPDAEVEVEYYNENESAVVKEPSDYMITQTIKADGNGVFTYATPTSGWWGFAALNTADYTIRHDGEDKDVEMGAVIWVYFHDWK